MNSKNPMRIMSSIVIVLLMSGLAFADAAKSTSALSSNIGSSNAGSSISNTGTSSGSSKGSAAISKAAVSNSDAESILSGGVSSSVENLPEESSTKKDEPDLAEIRKERIQKREEKERAENMNYIKTRFKIPEKLKLKEETIQLLIKRRSEDYENFKTITKLTVNLVKLETDKEIFANEIVNMEKSFVEGFYNRLEKNQETRIKEQVDDYISLVKNKKAVKVAVTETQIDDLFSKKVDIDSLIEEIWNS